MKSFLVVLEFELRSYFKNKVYLISTLILCLLIGGGLTVPRIIDAFSDGDNHSADTTLYAYYDEIGIVNDESILEMSFENSEWKKASSVKELKSLVEKEEVSAGFVINSDQHYDYYVFNTSITDYSNQQFSAVMTALVQNRWMIENNVDIEAYYALQNIQVKSSEVVLGKDGASNYAYTYILIMALYMMVLLYGQNIAVAIASEKSNRAVELLATSASSYALIFGKIIAGAIAGMIQFGIVVGVGIGAYQFNKPFWGETLDFLFNIPTSILVSFAVFGVLGYLLYAFMFGMIGAMAQKSEDVNSTSTPISIIYVLAFMATYMAIMMNNETLMAVVSYVPFSSFMGMFSRMAMMEVPLGEVLLSLVILIVSTGAIGILASRIYRTGLLMYGNKITFKSIFKQMKNDN